MTLLVVLLILLLLFGVPALFDVLWLGLVLAGVWLVFCAITGRGWRR